MDPNIVATQAFLSKATAPEDVFGEIPAGALHNRVREVVLRYRKIIQVMHPDKFQAKVDIDGAQAAFVQLTHWRELAEKKLVAGTYGDKAVPPPAPPVDVPRTTAPQVVKTAKRSYIVKDRITQGDIADLYACSFTEGTSDREAIFKVAQAADDNDLLENEAKRLKALYPADQADEKFYRYLPKLLDTFMLKGAASTRRVNVLTLAEGYRSLAEVRKVYPKGLDFRDVVWMFKRSLAAIGFAHKKGLVHGAVIPSHILVHPVGHGAKLVDWCYAVAPGEKVRALVSAYKPFYAPEILAKQPASPQTDIYMLCKCAVALLGGNVETNQMPAAVPRPIQAFLQSGLIKAPARRANDAWDLHKEFDELLLRLVAKPTYRELVMP